MGVFIQQAVQMRLAYEPTERRHQVPNNILQPPVWLMVLAGMAAAVLSQSA
jgi:hypothetical protein